MVFFCLTKQVKPLDLLKHSIILVNKKLRVLFNLKVRSINSQCYISISKTMLMNLMKYMVYPTIYLRYINAAPKFDTALRTLIVYIKIFLKSYS